MPSTLEDQPSTKEVSDTVKPKKLFGTIAAAAAAAPPPPPKGVVLDKDGKPCRTCTSTAAWMAMMKSSGGKPGVVQTATTAPAVTDMAADCPPDVEALGRSTWTLLHSLAATYPSSPSQSMRETTKSFINTFSQLYPCWVCAEDFRDWLKKPENDVDAALKGQDELGLWMCRAHNEVNVKLGKKEFDCSLWKQRWRDGWSDGRCG